MKNDNPFLEVKQAQSDNLKQLKERSDKIDDVTQNAQKLNNMTNNFLMQARLIREQQEAKELKKQQNKESTKQKVKNKIAQKLNKLQSEIKQKGVKVKDFASKVKNKMKKKDNSGSEEESSENNELSEEEEKDIKIQDQYIQSNDQKQQDENIQQLFLKSDIIVKKIENEVKDNHIDQQNIYDEVKNQFEKEIKQTKNIYKESQIKQSFALQNLSDENNKSQKSSDSFLEIEKPQIQSPQQSVIKKPKSEQKISKIDENFYIQYLPQNFYSEFIQNQNLQSCQICEIEFSVISPIKNQRRTHCRKCGQSICGYCAQSKIRLSQSDHNLYKVCDLCISQLENTENINKIQTKLNEAKNQIEELNQLMENRNKEMVLIKDQKQRLQIEHDNIYQQIEEQNSRMGQQVYELYTENTVIQSQVNRVNDELTNVQDGIKQKSLKIQDLNQKMKEYQNQKQALQIYQKKYRKNINK